MFVRYFIRPYPIKPYSCQVSTTPKAALQAIPPRGHSYPKRKLATPRHAAGIRTPYRVESVASSKKVLKPTASVGIPLLEQFDSSLYLHDNKHHLLLAATGSAAAIYIPNMIHMLSQHSNLSIRLIFTSSAAQFLAGQSPEQPSLASIGAMPNVDGIYVDEDARTSPWTSDAKILHIELRRWADLLVVSPLTANTMAKMACGVCDNLLLTTIRAWDASGVLSQPHIVSKFDITRKPIFMTREVTVSKKHIIVAPAMNTAMWSHPITKTHIELLEQTWGVQNGGWVEVLRPIPKELSCGDIGDGAMREWKDIVHRIEEVLNI